jgi:hypothetical protein
MEKKSLPRRPLLERGPKPLRDVYVHNRGDEWWLYADGYRLAAERLIADAENLTRGQRNSVLYPILFLYRQHLELMLKYIILVGQRLRCEATQPPHHHRLRDLWGEGKHVLQERSISVPSEDLTRVEHTIDELTVLDPSSDLFRYPLDKTAEFPFPEHLRRFDLSIFGAKLAKIAETLRHFACLLDADLDLEREFYHDLYGGYD